MIILWFVLTNVKFFSFHNWVFKSFSLYIWINFTATVPAQKQPTNLVSPPVSSNEENQNTSDPDKFCSLCHATFNNPLMAKQHYVGKKHKKQETKLKLMAHYGQTPEEPAPSTGEFFTSSLPESRMGDEGLKSSHHPSFLFKVIMYNFLLCCEMQRIPSNMLCPHQSVLKFSLQ